MPKAKLKPPAKKKASKKTSVSAAPKAATTGRNGTGEQGADSRSSLTHRQLLAALRAFRRGDFEVRLPDDLTGVEGQICDVFNDLVAQQESMVEELAEVRQAVGTEGRLKRRLRQNEMRGGWARSVSMVNALLDDVVAHTDEMARVVTAVAHGDLSSRMDEHGADVEVQGEFLRNARAVNTMADNLSTLSTELTRVAREVGVEGKLGASAAVPGVSGAWRELTEAVNSMASNLTLQVREIARVTTAVAQGDLSKTVNIEVRGEILELKNTINTMVDQLSSFSSEVTRVAREVGTEGKLGGQAQVYGVSGVWRELTTNVNSMANNLTLQVRNIAEVSTAIAGGNLSKKITVEVSGELLSLKNTINTMVDQLSSFADEVTRVAREVGSEGILGGTAEVAGASGVWMELTQNVNGMADNLTSQVRNIAEVTTAIANGDLGKKITVDAKGEILLLKSTINSTVDKLNHFSAEVTRVARLVGTEGTLGVQATVADASGIWRELTDNVNLMANNLTDQVRSISDVARAIAGGDLKKRITVDARGEISELKDTINTMVEQLSSFAEEVSRVAREVGTEGKLGGQASVEGVRGTWKELTDNVNGMAENLTNQVRDISTVATSIAHGDLRRKVTVETRGEMAELKATINTMVDLLSNFVEQVNRVSRDVGLEGKLGGQAEVRDVSGAWRELTDNVNLMASNLTAQVRDIAHVTTAVARGDLTKKITVEVRGEILELKDTVNTMVDQLSSFADEVTRVAREVGTEGTLGGQAQVPGVSGTWRELTDNVNIMARNLTGQVRGIARVVTAVAQGDLRQELRLESQGEIATLVSTINNMLVTLSTFADQVSGVARDVGVEGKLGGQADVPGAAGIWRDLTNNVNELAGNLTRQVRAIGDVAVAVTDGDLTQSIDVEARGEVALLKDNINKMIGTLATTTQVNEEQDWLKTNLARFTRMLQGQRDLLTVADQVLSELARTVDCQHGSFYMVRKTEDSTYLALYASYALSERKRLSARYEFGESMVGQAAREKKRILVTEVPEDYVTISSSLGQSSPLNLVVVPVIFEGEVKGVIELASFHRLSSIQLDFIDELIDSLGIVVTTIEATMRTDELLRQSQTMAEELQTQQEELQQTNEELEEKAQQLTLQKDEVEEKNREVGLAKLELEEKAEQLALTSKYKSQFLANMSHELRTPLNSLLILSQQLADNPDGNLTEKQVEFASTVHQAGADLLALINEILDLAKIESGTMSIDVSEVSFEDLKLYLDRSFRRIAEEKGLELRLNLLKGLPPSIRTDDMRLKQVLRNLLSNAVKFTLEGEVTITIEPCSEPVWSRSNETLSRANAVIAIRVEDTGIGIPAQKQALIFEAFQQADGGTSRRFGGTGLGLAISREIATLLGGELSVRSEPDVGSCFTLLLPDSYDGHAEVLDSKGSPISQRLSNRSSLLKGELRQKPNLALGAVRKESPAHFQIEDDRSSLSPGDRVLLVIEDERVFAETLRDIARERGFKCLVACSGDEGFRLAKEHQPHAISLDLMLPDMDGWVLMDRFKRDSVTRHIPLHIISAVADQRRGYSQGALAVLEKPVDRDAIDTALTELQAFLDQRIKRVLLVEDDETQRKAISSLIEGEGIEIRTASDGPEALKELEEHAFDCMVLDLRLPVMSGLELLQELRSREALRRLPIIVYTGKELSRQERHGLAQLAETVIIKDVRSSERLMEEAMLFLHRPESSLPDERRKILRSLVHGDPSLSGKKVLVVDDDVRNLFAVTVVLEKHQMIVLHGENGKEALEQLERDSDIDVVLMDIMMPEMDGFEAMRLIREKPKFKDLPIIALTAKAMQGDRQKCIEAGASDYVTKPVDPEQLVSLLRVWLYR